MTASRPLIVLVALVILVLTPRAALAQSDLYRPVIDDEEFRQILEALDLADLDPGDKAAADRLAILRLLYRDYREAYDAAEAKARLLQSARNVERGEWVKNHPGEPSPPEVRRLDLDIAWFRERAGLAQEFLDNARAALPPKEFIPFRDEVRRLRRARTLEAAPIRLKADLIRLVKDLDPRASHPSLEPILADYATAMDAAAAAFEAEYQLDILRWNEALSRHPRSDASEEAEEARAAADERVWRHPRRLEAVQNEFRARIAEALPEDARARFDEELLRRTYPAVFVPSPAEILFERLPEVDSLTPEQRARLEEIERAYVPQQRARREAIVRAIQAWLSPEGVRRNRRRLEEIKAAGGDAYDLQNEHPALPLWVEDNRRVRAACRRIRLLFTDEQLHALPPDLRLLLIWAESAEA